MYQIYHYVEYRYSFPYIQPRPLEFANDNVTIQLACKPHASGSDPLAELVRALARDSERTINSGSNTSGVAGAGTLQQQLYTFSLHTVFPNSWAHGLCLRTFIVALYLMILPLSFRVISLVMGQRRKIGLTHYGLVTLYGDTDQR